MKFLNEDGLRKLLVAIKAWLAPFFTSPANKSLDMNSNKIINLTNPTANADAANKAYVDNTVASAGLGGNALATTAIYSAIYAQCVQCWRMDQPNSGVILTGLSAAASPNTDRGIGIKTTARAVCIVPPEISSSCYLYIPAFGQTVGERAYAFSGLAFPWSDPNSQVLGYTATANGFELGGNDVLIWRQNPGQPNSQGRLYIGVYNTIPANLQPGCYIFALQDASIFSWGTQRITTHELGIGQTKTMTF